MIYFSGTGNTELVTKKIKEAFGTNFQSINQYKIDDEGEKETFIQSINNNTLIGVGFPVYDLLPPQNIIDFIKQLPVMCNPVPVFIYSTLAVIKGDCHSFVSKALKSRGYYSISDQGFMCPSNGVYTYENPDHRRYKFVRFEKNIDKSITTFCSKTMMNYIKFEKRPFALTGFINPMFKIFRIFSGKLFGDKYYRNLVIGEDCSNCRVCLTACPENNFYLEKGSVKIKNSNNCLRCLRCVSLCNMSAISFTSTPMKKRYTKTVRDDLFRIINV